MTRTSRSRPSHRPLAVRQKAPPYRLRVPELLEDRTVPAVTFEPDGAGRFVVRFTEDVAGAADTVLLRVNTGGLLEHATNGAPFTADLDSTAAGVQGLAATAVSRINVLLGAGDDVLGVDGLNDPAVIPTPGGIVFAAGPGADRLDLSHGQDMVLTGSALTVAGRTVAFTDLDAARLTGGSGDTVLDAAGFAGSATLDGGNGKDTLIGGSGNDVLLGLAGGDRMEGRGGNDQLFSGNSATAMLGGDGDDSLYGGNGPDQLAGEGGNDWLSGGNGADLMDGGDGNDTFYGGIGNDTAQGGPGTDRVVGIGDLNWTLTDGTLTGEGTDVLQSVEQAQLTGGGKDNTLNAAGFSGYVTLQGGGGNDTLTGGAGHNVFNRPPGEPGNVTMIGGPVGSTNDYFLSPQGTLSLVSTGGYDRLTFNTAVTLDLSINTGVPQVVDGLGNVVALTGHFEEFLGSGGEDTVIAASNTTITGGGGNDTLKADGKTNVTLIGGADSDSLIQIGGSNISLFGDDGLDSLFSEGGSQVTLLGGNGNDTLTQKSGTGVFIRGDDGLDTLFSEGGTQVTISGGTGDDTLGQKAGTGISIRGDDGLDTLFGDGGSDVTLTGGAGNDKLTQTGGTRISLSGDDGLDTLIGDGGTQVTLTGGAGNDTLGQKSGTRTILSGDDGLDTLLGDGGSDVTLTGGAGNDKLTQTGGTRISLSGDDGLDTLISTGGTEVTLSGGAGNDTLGQKAGTGITVRGDDGLDTLLGEGGSEVTLSGGTGNDTLNQKSGTRVSISGDDGLDTLTSTDGTDVTMTGGGGKDTLIQAGGTRVTLGGGADADSLVSEAGTQVVMTGDDGDDRLTVSGAVSETVGGGAGNDTIVLAGPSLGTVVIAETAGPAPDASRDTLDFSGFTGGPIALNLGATGPQTLTPGLLVLELQDPSAVEDVIGTGFADTITGNGRDNLLVGADPLDPPAGPAPAWDGVTQVVYLNFVNDTDPGEHVYDDPERDAIQARLEADYIGPDPANPWFHFQFVQARPASYPYAEVRFNRAAPDGGTGGFAYELDFRNTNLGTAATPSIASVQVNGILGAPNQPPESFDNWVALSAKIAAHELGHLVGLLHQDSFGPIGYGPHSPPGAGSYNPEYPGPAAGFETFNHLMSSPAAVGSSRFSDLGNLYFGEREAVKLTFSESGTVVDESDLPHRTFADAQPLALTALAVPNTLGGGLNVKKAFAVVALAVTGDIALVSPNGPSESDFYSFAGKKGDLINIEVLSTAISRLPTNINSMVRLYDAGHNLVAYYSGAAVNDNQFEATDSVLMDLMLLADGTYYVEVDTFFDPADGPDTDTGEYELFVYRFDAGNADDVDDVLDGRGGNDTAAGGPGNDALSGGAGNDVLRGGTGDDAYLDPAAGADAVIDEAGRDTLDFSAAPAGVSVDLGLDAGQAQTVTAVGGTLAVTGTIEVVYGSAFADSVTGNAADNRLFGGAGNDTIRGRAGNDVVVGEAGNDTLDGDDGRDLLIGGLGSDVLQGLGGDDILIGGATTYDANLPALDALMAEWTGTGTYAQRVSRLTGTPGGLNGTTYLIKGTTVLDDARVGDTLTGGLGLDLFFGFVGDRVMDREAPTETVV